MNKDIIINQASEKEVRNWCKVESWLLIMETKSGKADYVLSYLTPHGETVSFYIKNNAVFDVG